VSNALPCQLEATVEATRRRLLLFSLLLLLLLLLQHGLFLLLLLLLECCSKYDSWRHCSKASKAAHGSLHGAELVYATVFLVAVVLCDVIHTGDGYKLPREVWHTLLQGCGAWLLLLLLLLAEGVCLLCSLQQGHHAELGAC
jgi:hypothetical protein